jgi:hypothetical protein
VVLLTWGLGAAMPNGLTSLFLMSLFADRGYALGAYDGRVKGIDTGIAAAIDPLAGGNDPTIAAINGVYTATWNRYLNEELRFTAVSAFTSLNDQAYNNWDFRHTDPTGAQKGTADINARPYPACARLARGTSERPQAIDRRTVQESIRGSSRPKSSPHSPVARQTIARRLLP